MFFTAFRLRNILLLLLYWVHHRQAFVVTSLDSFSAGSQITNSYGQKSASQLLLHYGFIPSDFGQNRVELIENQITLHLAPDHRRLHGAFRACGRLCVMCVRACNSDAFVQCACLRQCHFYGIVRVCV